MNSSTYRNGVFKLVIWLAIAIGLLIGGYVSQAGSQMQADLEAVSSNVGEGTVATQPENKAKGVVDLTVRDAGPFVQVDILADGKVLDYKSFDLKQPARLVVDLPGMKSFLPYKTKEIPGAILNEIRCGEHSEYTRIVFESRTPELSPFKVFPSKSGITVLVGSAFEEEREEAVALASAEGSTDPKPVDPPAATSESPSEATLVSAGQGDGGSSSSTAESEGGVQEDNPLPSAASSAPDPDAGALSSETSPEIASSSGPNVSSGGSATPAPQALERPDPPTPQKETLPIAESSQTAPVPESSSPEIIPAQSGSQGVPQVSPPAEITSVVRKEVNNKAQPAEIAGEEAQPSLSQKDVAANPSAGSPPAENEIAGEGLPQYTGAHISLDFKDADIRNILRLIADVSNLNIVAGEDVHGTVTIKLSDVPWDQALDVILLSNDLGKTLEGNILRIVPMERLNKERQAAIADKEAVDKLEPLRKGLIPVSYAEAKGLKDVVVNAKALSPRGNIEIDKRTNTLIVIDLEKNIQEIRYIIDQLDTPTPEVLIEAKVVQVNPTYTRDLGVTWETSYASTYKDGLFGVGGQGGVDIDLGKGTVTTKGPTVDLAPAVGQGSGGAVSFGLLTPKFGINAKLAALEKEEKLEILSSPRIMTLDNQEATIEQGVDLPYLKLSEQGVTSTEFKKATLALKVLPHITADGSVLMEIEVKKDQKSAQTGAGGEPGIDTRRAESKVLVRDGYTVVIGGIYEETTQDIDNSIPFLGRLPVLGWMFKEKLKKREKTELIVFITPTIVKLDRSHPKEVALTSPN